MRLIEHQLVLGRCVQAPGADASMSLTADTVQGLTIHPHELAELGSLVHSTGFRFTRRVQRSWCTARTIQPRLRERDELPGDDRQEVVAGELPDLAGETDAAIGEQDLGLADATGVKEELTGRRVARRVLVAEAELAKHW